MVLKIPDFDTFVGIQMNHLVKKPVQFNKTSMVNKYKKTPKLFTALLFLLGLGFWNTASAQCTIKSTSASGEGCEGTLVFFFVDENGAPISGVDSIRWTYGTQTSSSNQPSFNSGPAGNVNVTATVYKNGVVYCTPSLNFRVNANPVSDFALAGGIQRTQCYSNNRYVFTDLSSASGGNTIVRRTFLFGDGGADSLSGPGASLSYSYGQQSGGCYTVIQRVVDNKGCTDDETKAQFLCVVPDLGLNFTTTATAQCGTTTVPFIQTSLLTYPRAKYFQWDFGDGTSYTSTGSKVDSCFWQPTHVYDKHGCFNVQLIARDDSGCWDTAYKANIACNINPNLVIEESNGKDAQCFTGNNFTFTHNIDPLNWPVRFLWNFGDPDSGPQNFDDKNFKGAGHIFTKPDLFTVSIAGFIANCPFNSTIDVVTKGPGATIESKMIPDLIADTQRHQCQIKDTVYFTNNSSFFLNDKYALDDIGGQTTIYKNNSAFLVNPPTTLRLDTIENVLDTFFWDNDTFLVVGSPLQSPGITTPLIHDVLTKYNNFFGGIGGTRRAEHTRMVWDFADNTAPQCTSWMKFKQNIWDFSKPVYVWHDPTYVDPINGRPGYYKYYRGNAQRALEPDQSKFVDTTYEWMNCNFSRDPIPKHWYSPGEERCYSVRLVIEDTTFLNPNDSFYYDFYSYQNNQVVQDSGGVFGAEIIRFKRRFEIDSMFTWPARLNVQGDTIWRFSQFCAVDTIGFEFDFTKPKIFTGFDTTWTKEWLNPNVQSGDFCEATGNVSLALMPPKAVGLRYRAPGGVCYGPVPPYGIFFNWQNSRPGCTQEFVWFHYDSTADRKDAQPLIFNQWQPQQALMLNPTTPWPIGTLNLPTWPTEIFKQYAPGTLGDSCGWITVGLRIQNGKNPTTNQPCIDEQWYHKFLRYTPNDSRFSIDVGAGCNPLEVNVSLLTDIHDSLVSMAFAYRNTDPAKLDDFFEEVDSVYRRKIDPVTGDTVNYVLTFHNFADGSFKKIDSFAFVPGVGGVVGCGSELRIKRTRKFVFPEQGRYAIVVTATNTQACINPVADFVLVGFWKEAFASKSVICKNETVEFYDTSLYFLKEPDPITGDIMLRHNYWKRPQRDVHPDGSVRTWPTNQRERVRWDFDQGGGFVVFSGTPTPNPKLVTYPVPGYYKIRVEFRDSLGCMDTVTIPLNVTGASANFISNMGVDPQACKPIVTFFDSSRVYDPCFLNTGVRCDSVIRWIWDFGDGSPIINTTSLNPIAPPIRNPSHLYTNFGDYDVKLIVETSLGCWDTIVRTISIEGPRPKFEFAIDSVGCVPYTVYLRNLSVDPSPNAIWLWDFGDGNTFTTRADSTVMHTYLTAGNYKVKLTQTDGVPLLAGANCSDTFPKAPREIEVRVLPERKADFIASKLEVCPNEIITFTDTSDAMYDTFQWLFGDGDTITKSEADGGRIVTHSYSQPGNYIVRLRPSYTPGQGDPKCFQTKSILISVRDLNADFTVDTTAMPVFKFTNTSTNGQNYWWSFGEGGGYVPCPQVDPVNCPNAQHDYGDRIGDWEVCLVAQSPEGCFDTACKFVRNFFEVSIKIPNVFTPNGDGFNDQFVVDIKGWVEYEIQIFNRYGDKVYQSDDPLAHWNGKVNNTGADCAGGVYYVVIKYKLRGGTEQEYNGTITLLREP